MSSRLHTLLAGACPRGLLVLAAPTEVVLAEDTVVRPDLIVVERENFDDEAQSLRPLLAVEILSPSTRHIDLALKRSRFEAAGIPAYWVVDPDVPEILAWEWRDGGYTPGRRTEGEAVLSVTRPFTLDVAPARLLD